MTIHEEEIRRLQEALRVSELTYQMLAKEYTRCLADYRISEGRVRYLEAELARIKGDK